jgi:uncharacterized protein YvpB
VQLDYHVVEEDDDDDAVSCYQFNAPTQDGGFVLLLLAQATIQLLQSRYNGQATRHFTTDCRVLKELLESKSHVHVRVSIIKNPKRRSGFRGFDSQAKQTVSIHRTAYGGISNVVLSSSRSSCSNAG